MELRFTSEHKERDPNNYMSFPLPCGKQIDRGLEIVEMISPILGMMAMPESTEQAQAALVGALVQDGGTNFGKCARAILSAGGHLYIRKLFIECKLSKNGVLITDQGSFDACFAGKGSGAEVIKVLIWLIKENFADFFTVALASPGQDKAHH